MGTTTLVWCHRPFPPESTEARLVTARVTAVRYPFFQRGGKPEARLDGHRHPHGGATAILSDAPMASL
jgi:quercetin dioxygenase-like cupin family protein